jgi:SAM-dependent methyltransferase
MKRAGVESHNSAQRRYFEDRVPRTMVPQTTPYVRRHVDELLRAVALSDDDRVIEIGCGMGNYTFELARRGVALDGLELSQVLLDRLRAYAPPGFDVRLHCGDILDPPSELRRSFDAVIGFFTLHHLHDLDRSIAAMSELLRSGGRFAFVEPNAFNPLYYLQIGLTPGMSFRGERQLTSMRPSVILPALRNAGLRDVLVHRYGFFPPQITNRAPGRVVERALERVRPLRTVAAFNLFAGQLP